MRASYRAELSYYRNKEAWRKDEGLAYDVLFAQHQHQQHTQLRNRSLVGYSTPNTPREKSPLPPVHPSSQPPEDALHTSQDSKQPVQSGFPFFFSSISLNSSILSKFSHHRSPSTQSSSSSTTTIPIPTRGISSVPSHTQQERLFTPPPSLSYSSFKPSSFKPRPIIPHHNHNHQWNSSTRFHSHSPSPSPAIPPATTPSSSSSSYISPIPRSMSSSQFPRAHSATPDLAESRGMETAMGNGFKEQVEKSLRNLSRCVCLLGLQYLQIIRSDHQDVGE